MSDEINGGPKTSFWIIGGAALVWNLIGLLIYYQEVTLSAEDFAKLTEAQQAFFDGRPMWATSAYAIAVTTGVLGSLLLLFRKSLAVIMFMASLAGIIIQDLHGFVLGNGLAVFKGTPALPIAVTVLVVAIALLFYSRAAKAKNWLA